MQTMAHPQLSKIMNITIIIITVAVVFSKEPAPNLKENRINSDDTTIWFAVVVERDFRAVVVVVPDEVQAATPQHAPLVASSKTKIIIALNNPR